MHCNLKPVCGIYRSADTKSEAPLIDRTNMTTYEASRSARPVDRWAIWAALVLGLMFLALGAPLIARGSSDTGPVQAEREIEARPNG